MIIYYTGATREGETQPEASLSLGGYLSSSVIPNDVLGNLFSGLSRNLLENKIRETRGIVLQNDSAQQATGIRLWFVVDAESKVEYRVAVVTLAEDDCGRYMELLPNGNATPYTATFNSANGEPNAINLPNMDSNAIIGLWIERAVKDDVTAVETCDEVYTRYQNDEELETEETVSLIIDYTLS